MCQSKLRGFANPESYYDQCLIVACTTVFHLVLSDFNNPFLFSNGFREGPRKIAFQARTGAKPTVGASKTSAPAK
jgi:hypothetical protein